jgi:peptidyl-dipeptidase Dcp
MVLKKHYEGFTRSGIGLPAAEQEEMKEINLKLAAAQQKFGNNLLAENNAFRDKFGIPISSYTTEMTSCADRDRREAMFRAYSSRGNNGGELDNNALCLEILRLRARKAEMLGFPNFAAYQLDNKMAKDPVTVDTFLAKIMGPAVEKAKREVYDMQQVMDADVAAGLLPAGSRIQPWDWFYYAEKVRAAKYALDESQTAPYFKLDNVREGVFKTAWKVYGIQIEPMKGIKVYHPEVEVFKVSDADGSLLGIFFCDYFPRSTKRSGAWMNNFRDQYYDKDGNEVRPIIVNVCNFSSPAEDGTALLTVDEVETAFHEFGHALHGFLTKCHYPSVSGTSVARDFVETFSQFNENWAFQPELLAKYAVHYQTGEVIPQELVDKIEAASKFNQGFMTTELCAASILDMKWHELSSIEGIDIDEFEAKVCKEMGLIDEIIPRYRTTYFNHIFSSGYSAGYYGYLWAEVLDKDAFSKFEEHGVWDVGLAHKFKETFLEKGGSEEPMTLFKSFMGREPDTQPFLKGRGLT